MDKKSYYDPFEVQKKMQKHAEEHFFTKKRGSLNGECINDTEQRLTTLMLNESPKLIEELRSYEESLSDDVKSEEPIHSLFLQVFIDRYIALWRDLECKNRKDGYYREMRSRDFTECQGKQSYEDLLLLDETSEGLGLIGLDINSCGDLNTAIGHPATDECIKEISRILERMLLGESSKFRQLGVYHYGGGGGDEWVIVASGISDLSDLEKLANRVANELFAKSGLQAKYGLAVGSKEKLLRSLSNEMFHQLNNAPIHIALSTESESGDCGIERPAHKGLLRRIRDIFFKLGTNR